MESVRSFQKEGGSRRRSVSSDSEQERHRRRRRKEREAEENGKANDEKTEVLVRDRRDRRDRRREKETYDEDRKRRRPRSPVYEASRSRSPAHGSSKRTAYESSRECDDRDSKYRSKRGRSYDQGGSHRSSREASAQVSRKSKGPLPSQAASFQKNQDPSSALVLAEDEPEKQKPNFAPSGLLAAASKSVAQADGTEIVLKYHEPAEARKPPAKDVWKLFVFKGADIVETIDLSQRSCWLIGRELAVVDMAAEHPSISKQHAVIQFRYIEKRNEYGDKLGKVRPYLIDLDSANGTLLNKDPIHGSRYLELRDKDMIQFGQSTREYVLMLSP